MSSRIVDWLSERWPIRAVIRWSLEEDMPGGHSFGYCFGASLLFIFFIQVVTGIMQLFYYVPTTDHAYQSVMYLRQEIPFGWLIHGLHYWGSNAFVILVGLHIARVFIWGAYKKPRQLIWVIGVLLVSTVLALSFIGALLPWDELGYWAAEVGTSMAGTTPVIGLFLKLLFRGGASMSQMTLSRFFILHVAIFPAILGTLIVIHLVAFRQFGISGPWKPEKLKKTGRFWPEQVLKDLIVISVIFLILVGLTVFWPAPVTGPADPVDSTYYPKPEWQFLFIYQFIKLFKGRLEPVGTIGVPLLIFLLLILLPFYDRNKKRNPLKRPLAMAGGIGFVAWVITYAILGHFSQPGVLVSGKLAVSAALPPEARKGAELFQKQGCMACHTVNGQGGNIGPNLSKEGQAGRSPEWIAQQIRDPKSHAPSTVMPSFGSLSDSQIKSLVKFLESLGKSGDPPPDHKASSHQPKETAELPAVSTPPPAGGGQVGSGGSLSGSAEEGKKLFHSMACIGCHTINGTGGSVGPDLSDEGEKGRSLSWIKEQIRQPEKHDPDTLMPSFASLSDQKVDNLAAYLESLKAAGEENKGKGAVSPTPSPVQATEKKASPKCPPEHAVQALFLVGNPSRGEVLFNKNCTRCHGPEGTDRVPNPGSSDGTVPPLNPIDRAIYNPDPITFARHIDQYIQHGSVPPGPHPEKSMPAFGDDLMLTQQMISELEAYVLSLNGVDRAKIMQPGVDPHDFFLIVASVFGILWIIIGCFWGAVMKEGKPAKMPVEEPQVARRREHGREEEGEGSGEADQPVPMRRILFGLVTVIAVVIVAAALYFIFSRFVTSKPVPHIPAAEETRAPDEPGSK
jgi:ubiquinol-cytochrome c reductase cytochrome b subunit